MWFNRQYTNIYFVGAVIAACFIFMISSTGVVMTGISDKTSADLALEKMQKECDKKNGVLVTKNAHLPLQSFCVVDRQPQEEGG